MSRRVLLPIVLLTGVFCASLQAGPVLSGTFNIGGNITVADPGFAGCPAATRCITWTDPPATLANAADISASGLTGIFATIPGFSGNDKANIFSLQDPPNIVGAPGFANQTFMSFNAAGVTTTLMINFIYNGLYLPTECADPPAVGQQCTVPNSLFNFVNNPGGPDPSGAQATATWALGGVTNDGLSTWTGNFTSQFGVSYQDVLTQLQTTGFVNNSYSATITVTQNEVPEAGTISLLGLGLVAFSVKLRRRTA